MTQIKLRRDTSANFTSVNPVLGVGEPAYETDTKKLKIGDGTTAYNSLAYFTMTDEFATYREKYGAPADSIPVVNTGNSITIKAGVSIETPNGTLTNATDMTYTYDFSTDRVLFVTENDYYHAYAVYYGGKEPSPIGEQIFWFNNNVWTMISGNGAKTVFNTQKITPIAKIYQDNGTVKNIDYSSYTKASAGGGGSTNITATLPLKIVDGVISLEVDGQTIQIVDGKLHANLDELGNKVNSLTGEVTDLSGRVTAAEADILKKENKITTTGALSLQEKIKTNAVGFTVTSESAMTNDHYQRVPFPESQSSRLAIQDASFTYPYKSYLAIPYSLGQVIRVPRAYGQLFFGSFDDNGDFIVSVGFNTFYYNTSGFALLGGPVYRAVAGTSEYPPVMPKLNPTQMGYDGNYTYHTPPREAADSGDLYSLSDYLPENDFSCAFYQITPDTTGAIMIQAFWSINNGRCSTAVYRDTESSYQYAGHLDAMRNNIQYALWLPNETGTSYNPSKFGLYDWNVSRIPWANDSGWKAFFKGRGVNLYSLTGQSSKNYLELNLGDGLSVVDGKLTASSTAPSNMVTTDTAQTISGDKTLTGITTISNDIKFTIGKKITTPDGQWLMQLGAGFIGIGTSMKPLQTYDGSNYYLHNKSIIAGDGIKITEPSIGEIKISSTIGNMAAYITETYVNGTSGYRLYSDKWCEQWGYKTGGSNTVTLLKEYKDTNYGVLAYVNIKTTGEAYNFCWSGTKTVSTFTIGGNGGTLNDAWIIQTAGTIYWKAEGYIA